MITILTFLAVTAVQGDLVCAVMGSPVNAKLPTAVYGGAKYAFCCGGCDATFKADPAKVLKADAIKGKTVGQFLFDPVSGKKVDLKKNAGSSDFQGLRYSFETAENKTKFDANPKTFTAPVKNEAMFCAVAGKELKTFNDVGGYIDVEGTRYYTCCENCLKAMKGDAAKYVGKAKASVKPLGAVEFKEKEKAG